MCSWESCPPSLIPCSVLVTNVSSRRHRRKCKGWHCIWFARTLKSFPQERLKACDLFTFWHQKENVNSWPWPCSPCPELDLVANLPHFKCSSDVFVRSWFYILVSSAQYLDNIRKEPQTSQTIKILISFCILRETLDFFSETQFLNFIYLLLMFFHLLKTDSFTIQYILITVSPSSTPACSFPPPLLVGSPLLSASH